MKIGDEIKIGNAPPLYYVGSVAHTHYAATADGVMMTLSPDFAGVTAIYGRQTHHYKRGENFAGHAGQSLPYTDQRWAKQCRQSLRLFGRPGQAPLRVPEPDDD